LTPADDVATLAKCSHSNQGSVVEVSVRELKNRLSEYLRRAQAGEEVVVTSHGRAVGRLVGPPPVSTHPEADTIARLRAHPWVRPGNGKRVRGSDRPARVPAGTTDEIARWLRGE
jgi:prevent-host-death family protein